MLWHCWLGDRKGIRPVKELDVGFLVVMIWLELYTTYSSSSPVVTTISIILCFNKHRLTQVHLEKWPLKWRERIRWHQRPCRGIHTLYWVPFQWILIAVTLQYDPRWLYKVNQFVVISRANNLEYFIEIPTTVVWVTLPWDTQTYMPMLLHNLLEVVMIRDIAKTMYSHWLLTG